MPKKKAKPKAKSKSLTRQILVALGIPTVFIPGLILASVLGWDWQSDLARLKERGGYYQSKVIYPEKETVAEVIDGDTIELSNGQRVRLQGVDAPELRNIWGREAKSFVEEKIEHKQIELEYDYQLSDKYDRLLAYVWIEKQMLNELLLQEGLAEYYSIKGEKKLKYELLLKKAEQYGKNHHNGLWYKSF
jgi:micrococcal nuclease